MIAQEFISQMYINLTKANIPVEKIIENIGDFAPKTGVDLERLWLVAKPWIVAGILGAFITPVAINIEAQDADDKMGTPPGQRYVATRSEIVWQAVGGAVIAEGITAFVQGINILSNQ